ncbi:J domain-containing protein [Rhizobium laguerreae]|nr:J domain-containing protein [Rhizobium laguerreae]
MLWGVKLVEDGVERVCLVASRGAKKDADEAALEGALMAVMEAAYVYWTALFTRSLEDNGEFRHCGVRVTASGEVSGCGGAGSVVRGRFTHEIDGDVLRLRFIHDANVGVVEWRPGLARDAAISILYDLREKMAKSSFRPGISAGTDALRRKAKQRIDIVVRDLAAVLSRGDLVSGRAKLQAFCVANGLQPVGDQFLSTASKLLVQKSFIQKSFEDIQRYNERIMQPQRSAELFEQLIRLGEHDGRLNARQLFALYEIGLFLSYSMPRITAMISAVLSGGDPWMAAEAAEIADRHREERHRAQDEQRRRENPDDGGFADGGRQVPPPFDDFGEFDGFEASPQAIPLALMPMMAVLGLTVVADERALRAAWTARVRQCHPDRLGPSASRQELEDANQATAEANMAYSVLLDFIRSGG